MKELRGRRWAVITSVAGTRPCPLAFGSSVCTITARNVDGPDQTYAPDTSWWARTIFASVNLEL